MSGSAILKGAMAFPIGLVDVAALKRACTIKYMPMGAEEALTLEAYRVTKTHIHIPRQLGMQIARREGIEWEDQTSPGVAVKFPKVPQPRDYQVEALEEIQTTMDSYYDFLFRARTGWGKTIGSLIVAARLGVSTLVVVDQENLKDQWIKALKEHFGMTDATIGIIQGKVVKFAGCPVTIAMVQTLSQKTFTREVYDHFGLMLVDETHVIGAPTFSKVLLEFSAAYRIGVSATPKRRDGLQKVLDYNLGKVRVYIDDEHEENTVWIAEHGSVYSWYANISPKIGRFVNEVAEDGSRNLLIAEAACHLYDTGRDVLVLSDRIEHLKHLMVLCEYLGIPAEEMGVYAGYDPRYGWEKQANPLRRPPGWVKHEDDGKAHYTPIHLQLIAKKQGKKVLEPIKERCRLIFGTYGMFAKGVDVPRLSAGIDASPRSQAEQVQGRILRKLEGKLRSIWLTIADTACYRSLHMLNGRIPDYVRNKAELFRWSLEEGETPCEVRSLREELRDEVDRLKLCRIETNNAGLNTLMTPSTRIASDMARVSAIANRTPSHHHSSRTVSARPVSSARLPAPALRSLPPARPSPSVRLVRRSGGR